MRLIIAKLTIYRDMDKNANVSIGGFFPDCIETSFSFLLCVCAHGINDKKWLNPQPLLLLKIQGAVETRNYNYKISIQTVAK